MKRYIITINEFDGIEIRRHDNFFLAPFTVRERFVEDNDGWCWSTRTATWLRYLLRRMKQMEKADRVDDQTDRFHEIWIVDVIEGQAKGQRLPYGDRQPRSGT